MQVHGPSDILDAEKISAHLNDDFAVVSVGPVRLYLYTPEECDHLIKAAVKAKELLLAAQKPAPAKCPAVSGWGAPCTQEPGHNMGHEDDRGEMWYDAEPAKQVA